jgi:DNA-binding NarL/FixJ family response regulator
MAANGTLLCIHRDPSQLSPLRGDGYELITATNGSDGLRVLMLNPVDAVVIEYYLGLLDGAVVADEIKQVKPQLPIVMVADHLELPVDSLKSVDAVVAKSDGLSYLLETIQSVLQIRRSPQPDASVKSRTRPGSRDTSRHGKSRQSEASSFSDELWEDIRSGTVRF